LAGQQSRHFEVGELKWPARFHQDGRERLHNCNCLG
jgi:hypothetical protein